MEIKITIQNNLLKPKKGTIFNDYYKIYFMEV